MTSLQIAKEALETIAKWDLYRDEREFVELALKSIAEKESKNETDNLSGSPWKRQKHNSYEPL